MLCLSIPRAEITISLKEQSLSYREKQYRISTSQWGVGTEEGSNKTPLGRFQISERFGDGEPPCSVFKGRKRVGLFSPAENDLKEDMILSRILRLSGMDSDNHNTYMRYIYIHGTNDECNIGTPKSIGCIRMKNLDIMELYNLTPLGAYVRIEE